MALQNWFGRGWLALAFATIYIISQATIASTLHSANASHLLFAFQFTYDAASFRELLASISAVQQAGLQAHFTYDHIHPIWYGGLIVTLMAWLLKKNGLTGRWNLLIVFGVIPSLMDVIENSIHEPLLFETAIPTDPTVTVAAICATIKWSMALGYLLMAIALGVRASIQAKNEKTSQ